MQVSVGAPLHVQAVASACHRAGSSRDCAHARKQFPSRQETRQGLLPQPDLGAEARPLAPATTTTAFPHPAVRTARLRQRAVPPGGRGLRRQPRHGAGQDRGDRREDDSRNPKVMTKAGHDNTENRLPNLPYFALYQSAPSWQSLYIDREKALPIVRLRRPSAIVRRFDVMPVETAPAREYLSEKSPRAK